MNIVIVGPAFPYRGGISHASTVMAAYLRRRGHIVRMVTFTRQYPSFLFPGTSQEEQSSASAEEFIGGERPIRWVDSINPLNWLSVGRRIAALDPDLVIFRYWLPFFGPCYGTIARVLRRRSRATIMYLCDNITPHERRPGDIPFTRYAFNATDLFLVQSDTVERQLLDLYPKPHYDKVPHPVYELFGAGLTRDEARNILEIRARNVFLFFGYIRKYKGLGVLLDGFRRFLDLAGDDPRLSDTLLLVVGEFYEDEQKYRQQIAGLRLEDHVRVVSAYVPTDAVAAYFSAANAAVLPYLTATQSGIAQIAYNFGTPVITTDVGGLGEVVRDGVTGFIVPPGNPEQLAGAMKEFLAGNHETAFSAQIAEERKKYSWERMAEAIERLFDEHQRGMRSPIPAP